MKRSYSKRFGPLGDERGSMIEFLREHRDEALRQLSTEVTSWMLGQARSTTRRLDAIIRLYHAAMRSPGATESVEPTYLVDAAFLECAYRQLSSETNETITYVTGPEGDNETYVLSRLLPLRMSHRSVAHARADFRDQVKTLVGLEESGHRLLAYLHQHPGSGAGATLPSQTDLRMQRGLEQAGYVAIGGIFSRDGYIRFFSHESPFRVLVTGHGVAKAGERLFRLETKRDLHAVRGDRQ